VSGTSKITGWNTISFPRSVNPLPDTTFEEAKRCPDCKEPGLELHARALGRNPDVTRGAVLHTFQCQNKRCIGFELNWVVQTNPDGTIPQPDPNREKFFPKIDPAMQDRYVESLQRQLKLETSPGTEVGR
jgi:hypothetical protein